MADSTSVNELERRQHASGKWAAPPPYTRGGRRIGSFAGTAQATAACLACRWGSTPAALPHRCLPTRNPRGQGARVKPKRAKLSSAESLEGQRLNTRQHARIYCFAADFVLHLADLTVTGAIEREKRKGQFSTVQLGFARSTRSIALKCWQNTRLSASKAVRPYSKARRTKTGKRNLVD